MFKSLLASAFLLSLCTPALALDLVEMECKVQSLNGAITSANARPRNPIAASLPKDLGFDVGYKTIAQNNTFVISVKAGRRTLVLSQIEVTRNVAANALHAKGDGYAVRVGERKIFFLNKTISLDINFIEGDTWHGVYIDADRQADFVQVVGFSCKHDAQLLSSAISVISRSD